MADAVSILVAETAAQAARPIMGLSRAPTVTNYGSYVALELDSDLQKEVADFLIRQLDAEPGAVRVTGLGGVFLRVLARKYWPWTLGSLGASFGLGLLTGGKKKGGRG